MENNKLPVLSSEEVRVLGCLIEKSRATPDYYPLTLNALVNACNQKSARNPVVQYDEATVIQALDDLKTKKLIGTVVGGGSRVTKYKHNMQLVYSLGNDDLAALCLLFLRGPLTGGEINSNSGRLYDFENLEEVNQLLENLAGSSPAFVRKMSRRPGQKENRFVHLFAEFSEEPEEEQKTLSTDDLTQRVAQLETELAELKERFEKLMEELGS